MIKNNRNKLLKRNEVQIVIQSEGNPGFDKARAMIAQETKASEESVVVKGVHSHFGRKDFVIDALVYDSVEDKERIEPKPKVVKKAEGAA